MAKKKVKFLPNEEWKVIISLEGKSKFHYAVSNFARFISFKEYIQDGYLNKISADQNGNLGITILITNQGRTIRRRLTLSRVMAECFLPQPTNDKRFVIHLDYNKKNNSISNLKWMSDSEMNAHSFNRPDKQKKQTQIIEFLPGEKWKLLKSFEGKTRFHYAISNFGRAICFKKSIYDGYFKKTRIDDSGHLFFSVRTISQKKAKYYSLFLHRAVAECFLPAPQKGQNIVTHLDHNKKNNSISNLKWMDRVEMEAHIFNRPDDQKKVKHTVKFLPGEEWRLIKSLEKFNPRKHYAVSDLGRMMAFEKDMKLGRLLTPSINRGYVYVSISKQRNKKVHGRQVSIHNAVAECFLPTTGNREIVVHKDGNKKNNHVSNLTWIPLSDFFLDHTYYKIKPKISKLRVFVNEEFRKIESLDVYGFRFHYAISNFGRVISYLKDIDKDGVLLKAGKNPSGYRILKFNRRNDLGKKEYRSFFHHKLMAECFLPPPLPNQTNLIHKDYNVSNNLPSNLAWLSKEEYRLHIKNSPANIARATKQPDKGTKLTLTQIKMIKRLILKSNDKIKNKILAKRFNISESHLRNIKTGKVWAHVLP